MSSLEIDCTTMQSIRYASRRTGYSPDYVTRLAREKKIIAAQVGRRWFVDMSSVEKYVAAMSAEQEVRKQQLSEERRRERQYKLALEKNQSKQIKRKKVAALRAKVLAPLVLGAGLAVGAVINQATILTESLARQMASAPLISQTSPVVSSEVVDESFSKNSLEAKELNFSHESVRVTSLHSASSTEGILVLPDSATSANVADLFSDEVRVITDENGEKFIARVDERDVVVEKIPYIVVPVNQEKQP
jgi:hypothetical protein